LSGHGDTLEREPVFTPAKKQWGAIALIGRNDSYDRYGIMLVRFTRWFLLAKLTGSRLFRDRT
jgi:hypothetical protein